jgi:hypothetical protein
MRLWMILAATVLLAGCDAGPIAGACVPGVDVICDIVKPEDIEVVPGTRWLMVSELGFAASPGRILLLDPDTKERRVLAEGLPAVTETETFPRCGEPPKALHPRGFHLSEAQDGALRVLIINGERIERYIGTIAEDAVTLQWEGCVAIPKEVQANDIAALGDDGFVVSHMYDPPRGALLNIKFVLGMNTGAAYRWTRTGGWARIPNSDVSFGNGIQVDQKTGRIYISSMFSQRIVAFDRDGGNRQVSARIPIQTDNISWSPDGRLIGAGHTGFPVYGVNPCRDLGATACSFPFAVVALDPKTLKDETLFTYTKGSIPGASVAVMTDGAIYLGTAFGERITRIKVK